MHFFKYFWDLFRILVANKPLFLIIFLHFTQFVFLMY